VTPEALEPFCAGIVADDCEIAEPSRHLRRADVRVRWRWAAAERVIAGTVWPGVDGEGLPGHIHGGLLAAVLDEAMGWACWMNGYAAPGASTQVHFRAPARPGDALDLRAWLERSDGRTLMLCAELRNTAGVVASATGHYIAMRPPNLAAFAGWPGAQRFADLALRALAPIT